MSRGNVLGSCGMVFGFLSVVAASVCLQLIDKDSAPDHQTLSIGAFMLVILLGGVAAASLFQHYIPTLFENAFGWRNFRGVTNLVQLVHGAKFGSLGPFLGYTFGVLVAYALLPASPTVILLMVFSGVLGFVTCWYATTERLPRGIESTVEVWLWHDIDQAAMREYSDEFFKWAEHEGSPFANYGSDQLYSWTERAHECGVTAAPTVSVRKLYYRSGALDTPIAVISSLITGKFSAKQIADEVRRLQAERTTIC